MIPAGTGAGGSIMVPEGCAEPPAPDAYACVHGDALNVPGDGYTYFADELVGEVEVDPFGFPPCFRPWGEFFGAPSDDDRVYMVRDEPTFALLTLRAPGRLPILTAGQNVSVRYEAWSAPQPEAGVLAVRDEDGNVLYWLAESSSGAEGLQLPGDLSITSTEPTCLRDGQCGSYGRATIEVYSSGEARTLEPGLSADIGPYTVLHLEDSVFRASEACSDQPSSHHVAVLLLPRGFFVACHGRPESTCSEADGCRPIYAWNEGELSTRFMACVDDGSCSDGDAVTCASSDDTGELVSFTTTCVPPGWSPFPDDDCMHDPDSDAGAL